MKHLFCMLMVILTTSAVGCRKVENAQKYSTLILGNWTGEKAEFIGTDYRITPNARFDTTIYFSDTGHQIVFNLKKDSLTLVTLYKQTPRTISVYGGNGAYTLTGNQLSFSNNPFSIHGNQTTCTIEEATKDRLVLYDVDTLQRNPLVYSERRYFLRK